MAKSEEVASEAMTEDRIVAPSEAEETETQNTKTNNTNNTTNTTNLPNDDLPTKRTTNSMNVILERSPGTRGRILTFMGPTFMESESVGEEETIVVEVVVVEDTTPTTMAITSSGTMARNMISSVTRLKLSMNATGGASVIEAEDVDEEAGSMIISNSSNVLDKANTNLTLGTTLRLIKLLSLREGEVVESKERRRCHR